MQPVDRFSGHADLYAQYRIDYPTALYDFIFRRLPEHGERATIGRAWDCATGNGQVAGVLADHFARVDATDISEPQLARAVQKPNVTYRACPAEQTPFAPTTFDLITVAQALHWFDVPAFHAEVRRVARPGAVLAEWGYGLCSLGNDALDAQLTDFYRNWVGPYWDPQRRHIDAQYATLPFPFEQPQSTTFRAERRWSLERFLNYLRTWSAVRQYLYETEQDPVTPFGHSLRAHWGDAERAVTFPIFLRVGNVL